MESIFRTLWQAGIPRHDLYLAWDFTVSSERNLTAARAVDPQRRLRASSATTTCATCA